MTLVVYNTLGREKQEFKPAEGNNVRMYVCGPTVYDYCHIGHARSYVAFDVIRRWLERKGFNVIYVQNFTDIDDKIINRANEKGEDPVKLAKKFIDAYVEDMSALGVRDADVHPRVSAHIQDIIETVKGLIDKGFAYEAGGDVYFSVESFSNYGKLSNISLDDMRNEQSALKQHSRDFALWKASKPGEPKWESPWSEGRPGWHIECSVMSSKYLGPSFDIHGGGADLVFPHHENEIAQAEAASGKPPFARYWLHNGFITIDKEKMSKSLDNFFTIREVLEKFEPEAVRFFLVLTQYRSPIDFSDKGIEEASRGLERLRNTVRKLQALIRDATDTGALSTAEEGMLKAAVKAEEDFAYAMDSAFNTAGAVAALFELASATNAFLQKNDEPNRLVLKRLMGTFLDLGDVLNIFWEFREGSSGDDEVTDGLVKLLIEQRKNARTNKDWAAADAIRDKLAEMGIALEDNAGGTVWKQV